MSQYNDAYFEEHWKEAKISGVIETSVSCLSLAIDIDIHCAANIWIKKSNYCWHGEP